MIWRNYDHITRLISLKHISSCDYISVRIKKQCFINSCSNLHSCDSSSQLAVGGGDIFTVSDGYVICALEDRA